MKPSLGYPVWPPGGTNLREDARDLWPFPWMTHAHSDGLAFKPCISLNKNILIVDTVKMLL